MPYADRVKWDLSHQPESEKETNDANSLGKTVQVHGQDGPLSMASRQVRWNGEMEWADIA
jgi:hypothetical protein